MRGLIVGVLVGCGGPNQTDKGGDPGACDALMNELPGASDLDGLQESLTAVQRELFPELDGVSLALQPVTSTTSFFAANLDLSTLDAAPLERSYVVQYAESVFELGAPQDGVVAILAHELAHVVDYTELDSEALVEFALWYAQGDVAVYERQTDETALSLGCATGLIAYREWLYSVVDDNTRAEKERLYYTPDEIRAWVIAHR